MECSFINVEDSRSKKEIDFELKDQKRFYFEESTVPINIFRLAEEALCINAEYKEFPIQDFDDFEYIDSSEDINELKKLI